MLQDAGTVHPVTVLRKSLPTLAALLSAVSPLRVRRQGVASLHRAKLLLHRTKLTAKLRLLPLQVDVTHWANLPSDVRKSQAPDRLPFTLEDVTDVA